MPVLNGIDAAKKFKENGYPAKMLAAEPYLEDLKQDRKFRKMVSESD